MAATKSSKNKAALKRPKRKARPEDRAHAAELARRCRENQIDIDELGREFEHFAREFEHFAREFEHLANYGTWQESAELIAAKRRALRRRMYRDWFSLRTQGVPALKAIGDVAEKYGVGFDTVNDAVYPRTSKARKT